MKAFRVSLALCAAAASFPLVAAGPVLGASCVAGCVATSAACTATTATFMPLGALVCKGLLDSCLAGCAALTFVPSP